MDAATTVCTGRTGQGPKQRISCYVNFAGHLQNSYNPNVLYPALPGRWSDEDWCRFIDMTAVFGFNCFEFWLVPRLFCSEGLYEPFGVEFQKQMCTVIEHGRKRGVGVKMLCSLTTVGTDWHTHCPRNIEEWSECLVLWNEWTQRLPGLSVVGIFPGDPGGCSRNGCTARTFIDGALEIAEVVKRNQPDATVEIGTWGTPFFGWGTIQGPPGWTGEFIQEIQHTAWIFDRKRADDAMKYLIERLPDFPEGTSVAINLAFNPDSRPEVDDGQQDARRWAREIAKTNPIVTWDFSLTEGEGAVIPHYRFGRLFAQRKREGAAAPYSGGICFTMSPLLNQLSLFEAARSFVDPDANADRLAREFCVHLFGEPGRELARLLPLFEVVPDWGNHCQIELSRGQFNEKMRSGGELLRELEGRERGHAPFHPSPELYRRELLFFFDLFAELTGPSPDFDEIERRYWQRVYAIYDHLPEHVDPRPAQATLRLVRFFDPAYDRSEVGPLPGAWI